MLAAGCTVGWEKSNELAAPLTCPKEQERLATIFEGYEATRQALKEVRYQLKRSERDAVFNTVQVLSGEVVLKNLDQFRVAIRDDKARLIELFVWNGKTLCQANFAKNETYVWPKPTADGNEVRRKEDMGNSLRWAVTGLYVGLPISEVKQWFHIQLEQEDKYWIYLTLLPRTASVKADIERMRVVLDRETFRLRQTWFRQANGCEVTIDFEAPVQEKQPITEQVLLRDFPKKRATMEFAPIPVPEWNKPHLDESGTN